MRHKDSSKRPRRKTWGRTNSRLEDLIVETTIRESDSRHITAISLWATVQRRRLTPVRWIIIDRVQTWQRLAKMKIGTSACQIIAIAIRNSLTSCSSSSNCPVTISSEATFRSRRWGELQRRSSRIARVLATSMPPAARLHRASKNLSMDRTALVCQARLKFSSALRIFQTSPAMAVWIQMEARQVGWAGRQTQLEQRLWLSTRPQTRTDSARMWCKRTIHSWEKPSASKERQASQKRCSIFE